MAITKIGNITLAQGISTAESNINKLAITTLSELQSASTNKILSIQGDIDLATGSISIPEGSILVFEGGSIKNGTINYGTNTILVAPAYEIFGYNVTHVGKIKREQPDYPEWFGVKVGIENKLTNWYGYRAWTEWSKVQGFSDLLHTNIYDRYYLYDRCPENNGMPLLNGGYGWRTVDEGYTHGEGIIELPSNTTFRSLPDVWIEVDGITTYVEGDTSSGYRLLMTYDYTNNVKVLNNHFKLNADIIGWSDQQHLFRIGGLCDNIEMSGNYFEYVPGDGCEANVSSNYLGNGTENRIFEVGDYNYTTGTPIENPSSTSRARTTSATPYDVTHQRFQDVGYYMISGGSFGQYQGVRGGLFNVLFYDIDDNFLEAVQNVYAYEKIKLVDNANYAHVVLNTPDLPQVSGLNPRMQPIAFVTNFKLKNNVARNIGRQFFSSTGFQNIEVSGNDVKGVFGNPGGFIDFEDARQINRDAIISNNYVSDCKIGIIGFDPKNLLIVNNIFKRGGGLQSIDGVSNPLLSMAERCENVNVIDNIFEGGIVVSAMDTYFHGNTFSLTEVQARGGIFDGNIYRNSGCYIKSSNALSELSNTLVIKNETFYNDPVFLLPFKNGLNLRNLIVETTNITNVCIDNIRIYGENPDIICQFDDYNAKVSNIYYESEGGTTTGIIVKNLKELDGYYGNSIYLDSANPFTLKNSKLERLTTGATSTSLLSVNNTTFTKSGGFTESAINFENGNTSELILDNVKIIDTESAIAIIPIVLKTTITNLKIKNTDIDLLNGSDAINYNGNVSSNFFVFENNSISGGGDINYRAGDVFRNNNINGKRISKWKIFLDNAAAITGGLVSGEEYITATGEKRVVV